ncbi:hypothetical protein K439DRAFT_1648189 [Ramaria rubella]|nr:hypothetical protein K439DRAFT_1648189 [Ramaria rubella]
MAVRTFTKSDLQVDVETEGDPTDGHSGVSNTFAESGVFVSVCHHGLIWKILDMIAKYPLATISWLLETLPNGVGLGYDIACSFWSTLMRSSLGPQACQLGLRMVVPAFHGHAHNRLCQLCFHIQISQGFGIEDLETCECVFLGSNAVARLTRHSTPYHR